MSEQRKKLAIIDGKSVFYRGYYAMPNLSTKDGTPTGGVYGFAAMALELIKRLKPDYVCVAWDKPKTNIRRRLAIYPEYKAGRKPAPPDFYLQIPILHELLEAFNWPLYELDDYEADDIMCGLAKLADKAGLETMLISSDLDMLQCVGPNTHMYALKKGLTNIEMFDPKSFEEKYGIKTEQFLDLKSLKGDGSDNIPGVPGIGEKTAVELLKEYETLDSVYENIELTKKSVHDKLVAGKDLAYMSKEIAKLFDDAPIDLDLTEMDVNKLDVDSLASILRRLEFKSLLRNLPEGMRSSEDASSSQSPIPNSVISGLKLPKLLLVTDSAQLKNIELSGDIVFHARSAGKHGKNPKVLILSDEENCYAVDLRKVKLSNSHSPIPIPQSVIGHDLKNSFKVLLELGYTELPAISHDTLIAGFIINALRREQSLSDLASADLGHEVELDNLDDNELLAKADKLAAVIRALATMQGEQMSEVTSLIKLADQVDYPVIPVLARMEKAGIKIDPSVFKKFGAELSDKISDIEQTIYGYSNSEFNISSPQQLSEILFTKLNLPSQGVKRGKTGSFSTASDVLEKLKGLHPIIEQIEQYRECTKLKNTYVDTLPTMADENDRIHTTFAMTVAQTGRLSSNDPNLQNIPVRTELGREIRKGFIAEKGNVLISADYSQFELRIAAAMSGDKDMIESFNQNKDIHTETAALVNGIKPEEVTKDMRYAAKAVNFGILYGQGVFGLSTGSGMSMADAKSFIEKYFEVRPTLKAMIERFREHAKTKGYVETLLGRRRPTPDVQSSNFMVREGAYRAAINMPLQGTAADLTKLAMTKLQQRFDEFWPQQHQGLDAAQGSGEKSEQVVQEVRRASIAADDEAMRQKTASVPSSTRQQGSWPVMLLQIHDSIMVECKESDAQPISKMMKEVMENIYPELGVNLHVDVASGKSWSDL